MGRGYAVSLLSFAASCNSIIITNSFLKSKTKKESMIKKKKKIPLISKDKKETWHFRPVSHSTGRPAAGCVL